MIRMFFVEGETGAPSVIFSLKLALVDTLSIVGD